MKIHIICQNYESDRIIPRLFTALAKGAKFTISDIPDDNADVNYFSLYMEYPKQVYTKTLTAALFSHKEINVPSKLAQWYRVAELVDIRFYWSNLYKNELEQYGVSRKIIPFLDRNKFAIK